MDIKGHVVRRVWVERASDIADGVLRELHARPAEQGPPRHALRRGRRRDRGGRRDQPRRDRAALDRPGARARPRDRATLGRRGVGSTTAAREQTAALLCDLYRCYVEGDCDLAEINPLILTTDGRVHALDAKVTLDDNAAFRHPEWAEFAATETEDPREQLAKEKGLTYIGLDGTVGIIANGAGLAMSTLDVVNQAGGSAANFLDIGGGANADVMAAALEVINTDAKVRSIFVNIFGGITRVDEVAKGILDALERVDDRLADRAAARRDQRRGGPRAARAAPLRAAHRRADDARGGRPRRRTGG